MSKFMTVTRAGTKYFLLSGDRFVVQGQNSMQTPTEVTVDSHDVMEANVSTDTTAVEAFIDGVSFGSYSISALGDVTNVSSSDNEVTCTVPDGAEKLSLYIDGNYINSIAI